MANAARVSVYEQVTADVVAQLEQGPERWVKTWSHAIDTWSAGNAQSGREYRGINLLLLALASSRRAYSCNRWVTFKQAKTLGGAVRKGERGTHVVLFKVAETSGVRGANNENAPSDFAKEQGKARVFARSFTVFNVAQCEGLPEGKHVVPVSGSAAQVIHASGVRIADGAPSYNPISDTVHMPPVAQYASETDYFVDVLHELVHSTAPRVGRDMNAKRWGDEAYAMEELVAELGSAMLCGVCGIAAVPKHAAYLGAWLDVLKRDPRAIFAVASQAQNAVDYLLDRSEGSPGGSLGG